MTSVHNTRSRFTASTAVRTDPPPRPSSITELAERAFTNLWDPTHDFKHWLRVAERARNTGQEYAHMGDLENAFVEYARAATLILDKMPTHREYMSRLNASQRDSLTLHGQELLQNLGRLKPTLTERYNNWLAAQPSGSSRPRTHEAAAANEPQRPEPETNIRATHDSTRWQQERVPSRQNDAPADSVPQRQQDDVATRRLADIRVHREEEPRTGSVGVQRWQPLEPDAANATDRQRKLDESSRARAEEKTRAEQAGIIQRQRESEAAARAARADLRPPPIAVQSSESSHHSSSSFSTAESLPILPLESPTRYDDYSSTDAEKNDESKLYRRFAKLNTQQDTPTKQPFASVAYPSPITTTSPPPPSLGVIHYPQLMSQHQRTQGYAPSLQSMFVKPPLDTLQASLLFDHVNPSTLYSNMLPSPSRPVVAPSSTSANGFPIVERSPGPHETAGRQLVYPPAATPPPPRPPKDAALLRSPNNETAPRIIPGDEKRGATFKELRTVNLPRITLPRFISIASLNTAQNRETCGLLLGKPKGDKYVVTTLLIPKQHSTSDTCTMDEEVLVLEFTEKRALITLGWIHTHPTQSCFMSSVDLHTHSGFQCMLPESFAVVCAPKSTPNFGIFRLTDPPGLQTILSCHAKEAFHPHPDVPIYTDADKGHVQMRDMSLEIVDLR